MVKNNKVYILIVIVLFSLFTIINLPIFTTAAFFSHSADLLSNISIETGSLDIMTRDSDDNNVASKNYVGVISTNNPVFVKSNFKASNIGSLSSILSATLLFDNPSSNMDNFRAYLTNKDNQVLELYKDGTYQSLMNFIGFGETFGIKVTNTGVFPQVNTAVGMKIVLRGTQPNDNVISPKMFVDTETIHFNIQMDANDDTWLDIGKGFKVNYKKLDMYFGKNDLGNTVNLNDGVLLIQVPEGTNPSDYRFDFNNSSSQAGVRYKAHTISGNIISVSYEINYAQTGYSGSELSNNIIIQIPITKVNDLSFYHQVNSSNDAFTRKLMLSTDSPVDWATAPSFERVISIKKDEILQITMKYIDRSLNYSGTGGKLPDFALSNGEVLGINAGDNHFTTSAINNNVTITMNDNSGKTFDLRVSLKGNSGNTLVFQRRVVNVK